MRIDSLWKFISFNKLISLLCLFLLIPVGINILSCHKPTSKNPVTVDFNGDGKTDLLWQHATSGTVAVWLMNGTTQFSIGVVSEINESGWQIKGVGDFNRDGKADILWQHSSGSIAIWLMDGTAKSSFGTAGGVGDLSWKILN